MIRNFRSSDVPDQSGKTVFITGANTGIGFEAAKVLAARGARVLLGCRNPEKATAALTAIHEAYPDGDLAIVPIDLADLKTVREAAEIVAAEPRLDVLINNAGIMMPPRTLTRDGFESQFGTNHLGPFALTNLLLPTLMATENARVVHTSSNAHWMGQIPFDDLTANASYSRLGRYNTSKLANLFHAYELERRLRAQGASTISVAVHPGGTDTDLFRYMPSILVAPMRPLLWPFLNQPAAGAWPTLLAATHPEVKGGQYFGPARWGQVSGPAKEVTSSGLSHDEAVGRRLWEVSEALTAV